MLGTVGSARAVSLVLVEVMAAIEMLAWWAWGLGLAMRGRRRRMCAQLARTARVG